ncbi:WRKY domain-containing protein [Citrus sinensis]|uniref:WRKY domain-containing protein n=1 Tax=Citrus sinensis TaxID=2711 RepID=A0ACB8LJS5_CITSI|nr:WRKY domain-containing protein [Citrus sinensis]
MENRKEKSLFGKACEEEETKETIGEEEAEDDVHVHIHAKIQKEEKLKSVKTKVGEIREENEKLKLSLAKMAKDYQSLQSHFLDILQQEEAQKSKDKISTHHDQENEEVDELVSLSLGRTSAQPKKDEKKICNNLSDGHEKNDKEGLALGLDCSRFEFSSNSRESENRPSPANTTCEQLKEQEPTEIWSPSKINLKSKRSDDQDEEVFQKAQLKKARVSVRARCDTPTVQRWHEDMSILITTYEGTHNHPLPISATAMASTTSAAASMLQCRSSTSQLGTSVSVSTPPNLHGLNFIFSENARPHDQLNFSSSSISNTNAHPTIVLDLTAPATFSHFNRLSSSAPRYNSSSTSLNFSSPFSTNSLQTSWSSGYSNNYANYLGKQPAQEHIYKPYMQMMNNPRTPPPIPQVQSLTESTIAATTKIITSNPNFQSALAAAISSYIGQQNVGGPGESSSLDMKCGKPNFSIKSAADSSAQNGTLGFASSLLDKYLPSSTHQQPAVSIFPLNSPPFSASKTALGSPVEVKDHVKI